MGNPHQRERYNAKARKSSSRPSKRVKRAHDTLGAPEIADSNADIVVPKSRELKEEERRQRLREELLEQRSQSKFTSKKKKRLEKYIDKKLKKEERVQILEKLAQSQAQLPTVLHLQPSSTLGSRKVLTNEELQAKQEDREIERAIDGRIRGKRKRQSAYSGVNPASEGDDDDDFDKFKESSDVEMQGNDYGVEVLESGRSRASPVIVHDDDLPNTNVLVNVDDTAVGSALRKNADGTIQAPKIVPKKTKGQKTAFRRWGKTSKMDGRAAVEEGNSSDSSFDSSDSAYDSSANENEEKEGEHADDDEWHGFGDDGEAETSNASGLSSGSDSQSEESDGEGYSPQAAPAKRKRGGFKDWAISQLSVAKGYVAPPRTGEEIVMASTYIQLKGQEQQNATKMKAAPPFELRGPLGEDLSLPNTSFARQLQSRTPAATAEKSASATAKLVRIARDPAIQEARLELPILAEEQPIVEAVRLNPVVVLCGATGSGKTTQVPQFLYEAGFGVAGSENPGMIGITQPRRVAAMSMASRVQTELALPAGTVAYQIRYDATTAPGTAIKFMTDGVLLRELASDFSLSKYSVIVVDEAHERSVNTDILVGVLSRVVKLREEMWKEEKGVKPLRLIIMSATLRVSDFVSNPTLFPSPPPVINVEARQYPVTIHFSRRTYPDYIAETLKKVGKIHARLPAGGILVFLTGQNEITGVCRKLEARYGQKAIEARKRKKVVLSMASIEDEDVDGQKKAATVVPALADVEVEEIEFGDFAQDDIEGDDGDQPVKLDSEALDTDDEESENKKLGIDANDSDVPIHVLPLYSILPTDQQMRVFEPPPPGTRLVVVSTNVAETSLTIPGIRYVVDCGRAKERCYDTGTGVQSFRVNWISKASADQRAGRAGRTGPGHCYRLYSSALFENHFEQFARPEILQMPIEGVVLQMKSMHIDTVTNFPFPTPPARSSLKGAEDLLVHLGALEPPPSNRLGDGHITELGKSMALFPLSPRFAKMLVNGRQHNCLPYVIAVVATLTVGDPFLHEEALLAEDNSPDDEEEEELSLLRSEEAKSKELNRLRRRAYFKSQETHGRLGKGSSDVFRVLSVVGAYEYAGGGHQFCRDHFVRPKAMEEIHKFRAQISNIVQTNFPSANAGFERNLKPPTDLQVKVLRQLLCSAFIDRVAVRKDLVQSTSISGNKYTSSRGVPYRALGIAEDVFIHPRSILFSKPPPDFVVFQEAVQSSQTWLKTLTIINPAWLSSLGKRSLCTFSKPTKNSMDDLMVIPRFGPDGWELPAVKANTVL